MNLFKWNLAVLVVGALNSSICNAAIRPNLEQSSVEAIVESIEARIQYSDEMIQNICEGIAGPKGGGVDPDSKNACENDCCYAYFGHDSTSGDFDREAFGSCMKASCQNQN